MDSYSSGVLLGVTVGVILTIVLLFVTKKNGRLKGEYDERQQLIRGKGFKYAFFFHLIFDGLLIVCNICEIDIPFETGAILLIGVGLSVCIYASYAILNDAYFALNEKVSSMIGIFAVLGILNFLGAFRQIVAGEVIKNGIVTCNLNNLTVSLMLLEILIVLLIKKFIDKKEASGE